MTAVGTFLPVAGRVDPRQLSGVKQTVSDCLGDGEFCPLADDLVAVASDPMFLGGSIRLQAAHRACQSEAAPPRMPGSSFLATGAHASS
jgi:hypothetical protein